jgi:acyl-CoA dehydrogenase
VHHPDVLRMLLTMKSTIEAMRALAAVVAAALDRAQGDPHEAARQQAQAFAELMIPVVKGWSTESAIEIASLNVQIHGGMGYIEETGAAQLLRDARITSIYEGTTGIQANDLTGRKLMRDHGQTLEAVLREMRQIHEDLRTTSNKSLIAIAQAFGPAIDALGAAKAFLVADCGDDPRRVAAGAVPFLKLLGIVAGGWQMARAALKSAARLDEEHTDAAFHIAKIATARFYADQVLPSASGLAHAVKLGSAAVLAYDIEQL